MTINVVLPLETSSIKQKRLSPLLMKHGVPDSEKTGSFVVVLKENTHLERFQSIIHEVVQMSEDTKLHGSVQSIAKAFTVKLSHNALQIVSYKSYCKSI